VVDCARNPDRCPPFAGGRDQAVAIARQAGLKPLLPSTCDSKDAYRDFCVRLYFFAGQRQQYVWSVASVTSRRWRPWQPLFWWGGERGRSVLIDPASGQVLEVTNWGPAIIN
jgi:hypothetical protein